MNWQTELQILIKAIASAFKRQNNITISADDLIYEFDVGDGDSRVSLMLNSKRTDDNLRIKAYIRKDNTTSIGKFRLMELANYGPGPNDEAFIVAVGYDPETLPAFDSYLTNMLLATVTALELIVTETGKHIQLENGKLLVKE